MTTPLKAPSLLSESAAAFLEAAFSSKLDTNSWKAKAKAKGTPDSCWIQ